MSVITDFNVQLIQVIDKLLPSKSSQVDMLVEVISLGKEAAYRRLRGDVLFTFEEACKIASKLGISLDQIAQIAKNDRALWDFDIVNPDDISNYTTYYLDKIFLEHESFVPLLADPTLFTMGAFDTPPHAAYFTFPDLLRFRAFEWTYQLLNGGETVSYSDIIIPPDMCNRLSILSKAMRNQSEQIFIFDRRIFKSLADKIQFHYELKLISYGDKLKLRDELIGMINLIESDAIIGKSINNKNIWIFMSNIDLNGNYTYVRGNGYEFACTQLFQLNAAVSTDSRVCKMQRMWIESLRRYSTLISIGGNKERSSFFEEQRNQVHSFLSPA